MIGFRFPLLGPTGEGDIVFPPGTGPDNWPTLEQRLYWSEGSYRYFVTYQLDRPACAFRCYYPGGSSPCDRETADAFVDWAKDLTGLTRERGE